MENRTSPAVRDCLSRLGRDISVARRARALGTQDMADRMGVDRGTLRRLEQGEPGVSLHTLAMALTVLGLSDRLANLVDVAQDDVALLAVRSLVPARICGGTPESFSNPVGPLSVGEDGTQAW